jgi:uncharacterized membrane protein
MVHTVHNIQEAVTAKATMIFGVQKIIVAISLQDIVSLKIISHATKTTDKFAISTLIIFAILTKL